MTRCTDESATFPPRPARRKGLQEISREWDDAARVRADQLDNGLDLSLDRILLPTVMALTRQCDRTAVLDVGCGTGYVSAKLGRVSGSVVAVDISKKSIGIARQTHAAPNLKYLVSSVESLARRSDRPDFTVAVANMTLMTAPHLRPLINALAKLLQPRGALVYTITHPCFWPRYWGYADQPWFDYSKEIAIEAPLRISMDPDGAITTHYHRPLSTYLAEFHRAGFQLDVIEEPMPTPSDEVMYPRPWAYPRFLAGRCLLAV